MSGTRRRPATMLTGESADLVTLLAECAGHHTEHAGQVHQGGHLAHACRELTTLRRALDTAHTAARDYYSRMSHVVP